MPVPLRYILICLLPGLSQLLPAQTSDAIRSDRPGQANGPFTVGRSVLQFQSGLDYYSSDGQGFGTDGWLTGNVVRYGLSEHIELNAVFVYQYQESETEGLQSIQNGLSDLQLGFRVRLWDQSGWVPDSCFQLGLSFPDVSGSFGSENLAPGLIWIASWSLPKGLGLTTNWILSYNGDDPYATGGWVVNFGFPVSGRLSGFVENYGQTRRGVWETRFDTGLAFLLGRDLQLDLALGLGENRGVTDYFISTGISWRITPDGGDLAP